jgi:hypothetical protein
VDSEGLTFDCLVFILFLLVLKLILVLCLGRRFSIFARYGFCTEKETRPAAAGGTKTSRLLP